jgi:hypothetical protein
MACCQLVNGVQHVTNYSTWTAKEVCPILGLTENMIQYLFFLTGTARTMSNYRITEPET